MIEVVNGIKEYEMKENKVVAINNINLKLDYSKGGFYVVMGHSGSGKSTLIQILGMLDSLSSGNYIFDGKDVSKMSDLEKSEIRIHKIGFIFQSFYLNQYLKAYENIIQPMMINSDIDKNERKSKAYNLLRLVNLENRMEHFPKELSGGEQQRVAIARALANNPSIILADEPTGNLDESNEKIIFELLKKISNSGKCVIVVSHNPEIKKYADHVFEMANGNMFEVKNV